MNYDWGQGKRLGPSGIRPINDLRIISIGLLRRDKVPRNSLQDDFHGFHIFEKLGRKQEAGPFSRFYEVLHPDFK